MPSGKTHDRITLSILPWLMVPFGVLFGVSQALILGVAFLLGGLMFGPDLDTFSIQYQRWGRLRFVWWLYKRSIPHRSSLSHGPVIGTLLRLVYLYCALSLFMLFMQLVLFLFEGYTSPVLALPALLWEVSRNNTPRVLLAVVGLELGAASHYVADFLVSACRRWVRSRRRRRAGR